MVFTIQQIIESLGIPLDRTRLVRHDWRVLGVWRQGHALFDHDASQQVQDRSPYNSAEFALQFVPGPVLPDGDQTALFLRAHRVTGYSDDPDHRDKFALYCADPRAQSPWSGARFYDLETLEAFEPYSERVLIRWGSPASTRSWSQWAARRDKEIVELRREADEPGFPGFARFAASLVELPAMPHSWSAALGSVKGVYLLVCPETGAQYVGSAYGDGGFWARWMAYANDGHGGNLLLRNRKRTNYAVTILEVASPDMSASDIIDREGAWKRKLGSRAHGLNAN